jgi:hypothetical protein
MVSDGDLAFVLAMRKQKFKKAIPAKYWPTKNSAGGCLPAGTQIDTPAGPRRIEDLRPGDLVLSLRLTPKPSLIRATVGAVATSRSVRCIRLNDEWLATPGQRIRAASGWVRVGDLEARSCVMDRSGALIEISSVLTVEGYFETYDLTINDPCDNYVAGGLLCHNNPPALRK